MPCIVPDQRTAARPLATRAVANTSAHSSDGPITVAEASSLAADPVLGSTMCAPRAARPDVATAPSETCTVARTRLRSNGSSIPIRHGSPSRSDAASGRGAAVDLGLGPGPGDRVRAARRASAVVVVIRCSPGRGRSAGTRRTPCRSRSRPGRGRYRRPRRSRTRRRRGVGGFPTDPEADRGGGRRGHLPPVGAGLRRSAPPLVSTDDARPGWMRNGPAVR